MNGWKLDAVSRVAMAAALVTPVPLLAQAATPVVVQEEAPEEESIAVTGTRIAISGYSAPTPVTVVGEEIIQRDVSCGGCIGFAEQWLGRGQYRGRHHRS